MAVVAVRAARRALGDGGGTLAEAALRQSDMRSLARRHRRQAPLELLQLRFHGRAAVDLRRGRRQPVLLLTEGDGGPRAIERRYERAILAQRRVDIGVAKIRERALAAAAEGGAVLRRRRDDERMVVLARVDEAAGITGRDDEDAPFDPRAVEHDLELPIPEIAQRQLRKRDGEHMPRAVRREVEEQDV